MVQEQKSNINFQVGDCDGHFGFPFNMILATFISTGRPVAPA